MVINSIFLGNCPSIRRPSCGKMTESTSKTTITNAKVEITNAKVDVENFDGRNNFGL